MGFLLFLCLALPCLEGRLRVPCPLSSPTLVRLKRAMYHCTVTVPLLFDRPHRQNQTSHRLAGRPDPKRVCLHVDLLQTHTVLYRNVRVHVPYIKPNTI